MLSVKIRRNYLLVLISSVLNSPTLLLLVRSSMDHIHIPGKLFEYIGARRFIFALSDPCEVTEIIEKLKIGISVSPDNIDLIREKLSVLYNIFKDKPDKLTISNSDSILQFEAKKITRDLSNSLSLVIRQIKI